MGMTPIKIQQAIQSLEPMQVKFSQKRSQCESLVHFLSLVALVVCTYTYQLGPLTDQMVSLKNELCGGNQTFVVGFNPQTQLTHALVTAGFSETLQRNLTLSELGVEAHKATSPETTPAPGAPKYLLFSADQNTFDVDNTRSIQAEATMLPFCIETMVLNEGGGLYGDQSIQYWTSALMRTAGASVGLHDAQSCQEMAGMCNVAESRLLRMLCGDTCGCTDPHSNSWFRVPAQGCGPVCLQLGQAALDELSCTDASNDETWRAFWNIYPVAVSYYYGADITQTQLWPLADQMVQTMLRDGCAALQQFPRDPITNAAWCEGFAELFRPLSAICPQSCGCDQAGALEIYCPSSCKAPSNSSA